MQTAAIIFLVLWALVGAYIYRQEMWWCRGEALISALLLGFIMTLGGIIFVCLMVVIVAVATGFI